MEYFKVKNLKKFQHYKDRCPPWIKLHSSILDDYEFGLLPDDCQHQLMLIWVLASKCENRLPLDESWLQKKLPVKKKINLKPMFKAGFLILLSPSEQLASELLQDEEDHADSEEREDINQNINLEKNKHTVHENPVPYEKQFSEIYEMYPKESRTNRGKCETKYILVRKAGKKKGLTHEECIQALKNYMNYVYRKRATDHKNLSWKNSLTWFNQIRDWVNPDFDCSPPKELTAETMEYCV